jgi:hypothetical protein
MPTKTKAPIVSTICAVRVAKSCQRSVLLRITSCKAQPFNPSVVHRKSPNRASWARVGASFVGTATQQSTVRPPRLRYVSSPDLGRKTWGEPRTPPQFLARCSLAAHLASRSARGFATTPEMQINRFQDMKSCLPMAPPLSIKRTETSVRRRFLAALRTSCACPCTA